MLRSVKAGNESKGKVTDGEGVTGSDAWWPRLRRNLRFGVAKGGPLDGWA